VITKNTLFSDIILHSTSTWCHTPEDSILHNRSYTLYYIVFLFSPNIIHMIVDSSVCNIF